MSEKRGLGQQRTCGILLSSALTGLATLNVAATGLQAASQPEKDISLAQPPESVTALGLFRYPESSEILQSFQRRVLQLAQNVPDAASAYNKYYNLLQVLNCPRDRGTYGDFNDYGYWGGGSWCGQQGRAGYWVWVYPNWYVWQNRY
ncbi:MAG: hypothetical protein AB4426_19825 [Xenococcaceae cyanobacterium]